MPLPKLRSIEKKLGITFKRYELLKRAFTHSSYAHREDKEPRPKSNETLEFLGDAVLELLTREHLFKKFPNAQEGELSQLKRMYTSTDALSRIGRTLGLGKFLIMDKGEASTGGRDRRSNIVGCLEALIGAFYLDRGLRQTRKFVYEVILSKNIGTLEDFKSLLNQWIMQNRKTLSYRVAKQEGPPHRRAFYVDLYINRKKMSRGKGASKKEAEQEAAKKFLRKNVKRQMRNDK